MTITLFLDLLKETIFTSMILCSPVLVTALVVGLLISLLQAVTSLQEQTITFVPKILTCGAVLIFTAPWMLDQLTGHTRHLFAILLELAKSAGGG